MKRRVAITISAVLLVTLVAAGALTQAARRSPVAPAPSAAPSNPAHFVASDVALLSSTGRPQLVEVFHYG
jgi:hypothetical protein